MQQGTGASGRAQRGRRVVALAIAAVVVAALVGCEGKLAHHAGTGVAGYSGDGGAATAARFDTVADLVALPGGGFYAIDAARCVIRKVPPSGSPVTTIAGTGVCGNDGDGPDAASRRINPTHPSIASSQLALAPDGSLLFADVGNGVVRRVGTDGSLTTVFGDGSPGASDHGYCRPGRWFPTGVAVAADGTIYLQCFWDGVFRLDGTVAVPLASSLFGGGLEVDGHGRLWWVNITAPVSYVPSLESYDLASGTRTTATLPAIPTALAIGTDGRPLVAYGNRVWRVLATAEHQALAGTGAPDPGGAVQQGDVLTAPLSPTAIGVGRFGVLVASGSVIYHTILPGPPLGACDGAAPHADLTGADLRGCDLRGRDLTGANLSGADLSRADLSGADLSGVVITATTALRNATLSGADIDGTDLSPLGSGMADGLVSGGLTGMAAALPARSTVTTTGHLVVTGANLNGADLSGQDLSGTDLARVSMAGTDLGGAVLAGVASGSVAGAPAALPSGWRLVVGHLVGPGADLFRAPLHDLDLSGVDLSGANLDRTNFTLTDLSGADLRGARLASATLNGTNLSGVDLRGATFAPTANNAAVGALDVNLTGANLDGVHLAAFTSFRRVRGVGIVGTPASLPPGARLNGDHLVSAEPVLDGLDVSGFDLRGIDFRNARLDGTVMTGANLDGARAGKVVGTPAALPGPGYAHVGTWIIGPRMDLSHPVAGTVQFNRLDLTGVDLSGTTLTNASFAEVTGSPVGGATATYHQTTCPDGMRVSAPDTCVGRGFAA